MKTKRLLAATLFFSAFALVTNAKTVYCSYNGSNNNNGLSWATAVLSLDTAKVRAAAGDNIWIQGDADGLSGYNSYTRTSTEAGQGKEALSIADLNVFGGFKGNETELSQRQLIDADANGIIEPWEFKYPTRFLFELSNGARAFVCGGQTNARIVDGLEFWMPTNYDFSTLATEVQLFVIGPNTAFKNCTIKDAFLKTNNASLRPFVWNKGRMEYCLVQNNTVSGVFSGTTDIQFSPLIELLHQQKLTDITPGIVSCVIRNNKTIADFSNSTLTSLAGRQRGLLMYINLHDPAKGTPSLIVNNLIYNNECSYIKSATSPATTNGGLFGTGFNNGTGPSTVYIINNTIANNKISNLGANLMLINAGATYYSNIINNVYYKNVKYLNGSTVDPTTVELASSNSILGNIFNNYATGKSYYNNPAAPKRIAGNVTFEIGANDKALFVNPTTTAGVLSDDSYQKANWSLQTGSFLIGKGVAANLNDTVAAAISANTKDISGRAFGTFRSVGAFEEGSVSIVTPPTGFNNPIISNVNFVLPTAGGIKLTENGNVQVISMVGQLVVSTKVEAGEVINLKKGIYLVRLLSTKGIMVHKVIL
jgi:hypothetical protein